MPIERMAPEGLHRPTGYSHVVRARGTTVYIAGQVAADTEGNPVAVGDLAGQARQVFANLRAALAAVGAGFEHVVKTNTYIVGYSPEMREVYGEARVEAMGEILPASTLVGVQSLARPEYLIEIEAVAVLDE